MLHISRMHWCVSNRKQCWCQYESSENPKTASNPIYSISQLLTFFARQSARRIRERKYFTTEISLFPPALLPRPFLPRVHSQKLFTAVLMRIRNFHWKKGLCSWCISRVSIFSSPFLSPAQPAARIYLSHFVAEPQKPSFFDCFHRRSLISLQAAMNDQFSPAAHLINTCFRYSSARWFTGYINSAT